MKELTAIQSDLKSPKNQVNNFGKYKYRSLEDIQEALKPLLKEHDCYVTLTDDIVMVGDRIYVKATATIFKNDDPKNSVSVSAFARESLSKKGMDESQITGSASSYARKYAMNGLFAIDDTKDAEATNTHGQTQQSPSSKLMQIANSNGISPKALADKLGVTSQDQQGVQNALNNIEVLNKAIAELKGGN